MEDAILLAAGTQYHRRGLAKLGTIVELGENFVRANSAEKFRLCPFIRSAFLVFMDIAERDEDDEKKRLTLSDAKLIVGVDHLLKIKGLEESLLCARRDPNFETSHDGEGRSSLAGWTVQLYCEEGALGVWRERYVDCIGCPTPSPPSFDEDSSDSSDSGVGFAISTTDKIPAS